jgi:fatty acid desaturase
MPGYRDAVRKDPQSRESRAPAIAIWTVSGLLVGLAFGIVVGGVLVPMLVAAVLGALFGLFTTRSKPGSIDDE